MELFRKIKNCKRHKHNLYLKNKATDVVWLADVNIKHHRRDRLFIVNPLYYEIIRFNNDYIPDNIKCSPLVGKDIDFVMTVDGTKYGVDEKINISEIYGKSINE
jgi:hypothetical protein